MKRLRNDAGEINIVKIFLTLALAAGAYYAWVYVPLWLDYQSMKKAVRTGCNAAYASRREDTVQKVILNGFKETKIQNQDIAADGSIISRPMEYSEALFEVHITQSPPEVTVDLEYEQQIVMPIFKKVKTVTWRYSHTEDLSKIEY